MADSLNIEKHLRLEFDYIRYSLAGLGLLGFWVEVRRDVSVSSSKQMRVGAGMATVTLLRVNCV
jgi:hypothetical protein